MPRFLLVTVTAFVTSIVFFSLNALTLSSRNSVESKLNDKTTTAPIGADISDVIREVQVKTDSIEEANASLIARIDELQKEVRSIKKSSSLTSTPDSVSTRLEDHHGSAEMLSTEDDAATNAREEQRKQQLYAATYQHVEPAGDNVLAEEQIREVISSFPQSIDVAELRCGDNVCVLSLRFGPREVGGSVLSHIRLKMPWNPPMELFDEFQEDGSRLTHMYFPRSGNAALPRRES